MIYLREVSLNDVEIINKWRNDKESIDLLGANFRYINLETDKEWFINYQKNRDSQIRCIICLNDSAIGMVNLTSIDNINRKAEFSLIIGCKDYRGKGYGIEAAKLMIQHGFDNLNLNKIYLKVLENNRVAKNLYLKVGFDEEGILREEIYKNGVYINIIVMSILKEKYLKIKN